MAFILDPNKEFIKKAIFAGVGTAYNLSEIEKKALLREAIRQGGAKVLQVVQTEIRQKQLYQAYIRNSNIQPNPNQEITPEAYSNKFYSDAINDKAKSRTNISKTLAPREAYILRYDLKNLKTGSSKDLLENQIRIQFIPLEMEYEPSTNWVTIPTVGRNNPFYHYTGGEDILKFTLDWNSNDPTKKDVIAKCRFIESLCRNDGYDKEPPILLLVFGDLFKQSKWILTAAPYKMSLFDVSNGLLPTQAYQEITLRRVVESNRKWSDILGQQ